MSPIYLSVSVVLFLCFNVTYEEVLSADQNLILGVPGIEDAPAGSQSEENIKNHLSLLISSLRNEIYDKNKIVEQKLNVIETIVKHGFEDTIDEKLYKFEKKIEEKIRENCAGDMGSGNVKRSTQISQTVDHNYKLSDLKTEIIGLKSISIANGRKVDSLAAIVENSHKIDPSQLNMLLNMTVDNTNSIKMIENRSIESFLKLSAVTYKPIHDSEIINELISKTTAFMHQLNETTKRENEFREIRWSDCKKESVKNNLYYDYSRPLHPLADDTHRHVTLRTKNNGDTKFFLLHVGIQADTGAGVILSQEAEPKGRGYHFRILIWNNETVLGTVKDGDWNVLKTVQQTNNLSNCRPFGVYIKIADDTVEVRREEDRVPILLYKEARFTQVRYFGFSSHYNTGGNATFLYDC